MTDGDSIVIIPRQPVIKPGTLRQILDAASLTADQFKELLLSEVMDYSESRVGYRPPSALRAWQRLTLTAVHPGTPAGKGCGLRDNS